MKKVFWTAVMPMLVLGLSACEMETGATTGSVPRPPQAVTLPVSGLSVAGPTGFCVDPESVRDSERGAFVLLGSCTGLSGGNNPGLKGRTAVLTLSVSAPLTESDVFDAASVEAFFNTQAGRRTLSRRGSANSVTLIESDADQSHLWLHARDTAPTTIAGQGDEYWRALFVLNGRMVTATATPFADGPMSSQRLRELLERFVSGLERRNRGQS